MPDLNPIRQAIYNTPNSLGDLTKSNFKQFSNAYNPEKPAFVKPASTSLTANLYSNDPVERETSRRIVNATTMEKLQDAWKTFLNNHPDIDKALTTMGKHPVATTAGATLIALGMYAAAKKWNEFRKSKLRHN